MKKVLFLILTAAIVFTLCACGLGELNIEPSAPATDQPTPVPTIELFKGTLYVGDDNAEHLLPVECELAELDAQNIVDKLYELGVFSSAVTVNSCERGSINIIKLDMGEDFAQQINAMGTAGEYIMMGSLVNSFLSVYEADGMYLTVNGEILETGHCVYDETMIFYQE